jgi:Ni,Fe-hydrogenase I cytochrome b subunit
MEKHINVVASLQIGLSILGLFIAGLLFTLFHLIGDIANDHEAEIVLSIIANVLMIVMVILSIPSIIAGIGLFKRKEWARILTLIISVLDLFNFPLGTAVGVYSIWAMVQPETVEIFKNENLKK